MKTFIKCKDGTVNGAELIKLVHQAITHYIEIANLGANCPGMGVLKEGKGRKRSVSVKYASGWLHIANNNLLCASNKSLIDNKDDMFIPCSLCIKSNKLSIGSINFAGQVKKPNAARLYLLKKIGDYDILKHVNQQRIDLTYNQINNIIRDIKNRLDDEQILKWMYNSILCDEKTLKKVYKNETQFLDAYFLYWLVGLMFGVENSRNLTGCLTTLMLMDLIWNKTQYGNNKTISMSDIFVSNRDLTWEEGEQNKKCYGGKYPMARDRVGAGNLKRLFKSNERQTVFHNYFKLKKGPDKNKIVKDNSVTFKEVAIIVHWLEAHFGDKLSETNVKQIKRELENRLKHTYTEEKRDWKLGHLSPRKTDKYKNINKYTYVKMKDNIKRVTYYESSIKNTFHIFKECKLVTVDLEPKDKELEINDWNNFKNGRKVKNLGKMCVICKSILNEVGHKSVKE